MRGLKRFSKRKNGGSNSLANDSELLTLNVASIQRYNSIWIISKVNKFFKNLIVYFISIIIQSNPFTVDTDAVLAGYLVLNDLF